MKKKSLFLVCCTLLMLLALAAPALADIEYYAVGPNGTISAFDESTGTLGTVETIPAGSKVFCGYSWVALTRGVTAAGFPAAIRQTLSVTGPGGPVGESATEENCRTFWGPLYLWNERWYNSPEVWFSPFNPKVASGVWARNWYVPCGVLGTGEYTITYNDKLIRHMADPLWYPGPSVWWPGDWREEPVESTFTVVAP